MSKDKYFNEFYVKLNDIVNFAFNLGEVYDQPKIVRKILRSLIEDFRSKVTAIIESKDVDSIPIDELVRSLQSYESDLPKSNKFKSMASTEIAYFVNFRNFLRNNNRRARNRNNVDPKNVKKNDTTKNKNSKKSKEDRKSTRLNSSHVD